MSRPTFQKALAIEGGPIGLLRKVAAVFLREGPGWVARRVAFLKRIVGENPHHLPDHRITDGVYHDWIKRNEPQPPWPGAEIAQVAEEGPLISILLPVYNPDLGFLEAAIESVMNQVYPRFELCIADDASATPEVRQLLDRYSGDPRVRVTYRAERGHISRNTSSAAALANGTYLTFLDQDDVLAPLALFWVAAELVQSPGTRLVYSDEDKLNDAGERTDPYFKPDWNYDLLLSQNYLCHMTVIEAGLFRELGGHRAGFEGAQDHDLVLRAVERLQPAEEIRHIPRILYHWRAHAGSTAADLESKPYALEAGRQAIEEHLARIAAPAVVALEGIRYRVTYHGGNTAPPEVAIIIPTRNQSDLLRACVESILNLTTYPNYHIVIVDNGSDAFEALEYLRQLSTNPRVSVQVDNSPFNFSALNNRAVERTSADLLCLLNNDIEVIEPAWLDELAFNACRNNVGIVGAKLHYTDGRIQHAGVVLGIGGVAGHAHKYYPQNSEGYFSRLNLRQDLSAVTGACLMIRRTTWETVGGLDESLQVAFNDVDLCLRVRALGQRIVFTPYARLFHHESVSRGHEDTPEKQERFKQETELMLSRWQHALHADPAYSPNLTREHEDFSIAETARVPSLTETLAALKNMRRLQDNC